MKYKTINGMFVYVIKKYIENGDWATNVRKNNSINYQVQTVSLNNLLKEKYQEFNVKENILKTIRENYKPNEFVFKEQIIEILSS